ncbi:sodium:proton antiporter [Calidifontibacter sp. DB0510]|uniref:Sodium:proton antiporter n=1 Tax=Metallococcus carri TaxID=1656884 RepID=A0A967B2W8_9MICO|nr:DUF6328 family protein [Metallococcus carri]NHN57323.1 sodium:proton antiporter [Metallococcus carri]NOP38072.1 sodium:proton antiporter [Calidifontibacter sp. DB2511S]
MAGTKDRNETPAERADRNWDDLLQELRVVQTGVQLQAGFLMTLPFQQRFATITATQRTAYLVAFGLAILATALLIAPVAVHRTLFRKHRKDILVTVGARLARSGLAALALSFTAAIFLIFDLTMGRPAAIIAVIGAVVIFGSLWVVLPVALKRQLPQAPSQTQ